MPRGDRQRRLHKALLRYHDPANWALIRSALEAMGKKHLIGARPGCLVPAPTVDELRNAQRKAPRGQTALTRHTPMNKQHRKLKPRAR